jgi:hypothetical protein
MNKTTAQEIAVTWELLNGPISDPAMKMLLRQLSEYDETALLKALARCRAECKGRITPADIISRIDDGRPSAEEAWAIADTARKDENATVVWTEEIAAAYGTVRFMDDNIAARMAFKDAYKQRCDESRANKQPVRWTPSLGEYSWRQGPIFEAVILGRLSAFRARQLVPELPPMPGEKTLPAHESDSAGEVFQADDFGLELDKLCQGVVKNCDAKIGE